MKKSETLYSYNTISPLKFILIVCMACFVISAYIGSTTNYFTFETLLDGLELSSAGTISVSKILSAKTYLITTSSTMWQPLFNVYNTIAKLIIVPCACIYNVVISGYTLFAYFFALPSFT